MKYKKGASLVTGFFDKALFGEVLHSHRIAAGYTNNKEFSEAIKEKAGVYIAPDTIYKYERGEREPDISRLVAFAITIREEKYLSEISSLIRSSMPLENMEDEAVSYVYKAFIDECDEAEQQQASALDRAKMNVKIVNATSQLQKAASQLNEVCKQYEEIQSSILGLYRPQDLPTKEDLDMQKDL